MTLKKAKKQLWKLENYDKAFVVVVILAELHSAVVYTFA